jgi:pimeloyl-ACP methyl ester carboxylesterase
MNLSHYADLPGGARLFYTDEGTGETLLFVHGWTCDSNDFLLQLAWFRSHYRVIAPDLRGHGRSKVLKEGYEARVFGRDLIELLNQLGVRTCVAVGHSLGGLIVSALAVECPERVRAIVCLDPAYGITGKDADECQTLIDRMSTPGWEQILANEFADSERPSTPAYFRELHWRRMLAMDRMVVKETFMELFSGRDPLAYRERSESYLCRRNCPVLSVYALDRAEYVEWERRCSGNRADRFLHFPLGHWVQQDAPEIINQLIEHWLGTVSDPVK